MIADCVIILILIGFTVIGALRGFIRTLFNLAGMALSLFLSNLCSGALSGWLYATFIRPTILSNLEAQITQYGVSETAANSLQSVPPWISSLLSAVFAPFGVSMEELQQGVLIDQTRAQAIARSIEEPLGTVITAVLGILLTALLFSLLMLAVKLIIHAVTRRVRFLPIGGINRVFGGIFGLLEGIVFVCIAINLFYVIMTYASPAFFDNPRSFGTLFRALCVYI